MNYELRMMNYEFVGFVNNDRLIVSKQKSIAWGDDATITWGDATMLYCLSPSGILVTRFILKIVPENAL